jgi:hypothetical protein
MQLYLRNWHDAFLQELATTRSLRIVSPFVKDQVLRTIGRHFPLTHLELITRFNLADFASGVSSLEALQFAVHEGSTIYGIQNLHSKIYLFDRRGAIITSANLTQGGMVNNFECGIYITDGNIIDQLHHYVDELKSISVKPLTSIQCDQWRSLISRHTEVTNSFMCSLPDYGATQVRVAPDRNYYVKFFGKGDNRVSLDFSVREEVDRALCHYACCFSRTPRQFKTGDILYFGRMTSPRNLAIFGKVVAVAHDPKRDMVSPEELMQRDWKANWPYYLRVTKPEFVDGLMRDCVMLYDLIRHFDYQSFASTLDRYQQGDRTINPFLSLSQQPSVQLTATAAQWLDYRFTQAIERKGRIPDSFIARLPVSLTVSDA